MKLIKSNSDQKALRQAAKIAGTVLDILMAEARPGVSTVGLEARAVQLLAEHRSSAPFRQFENFGQATCISLNEEIVNAPPSRERILKAGDLLSIAIGSEYRGLHGKAARTKCLGEPTEDVKRLLKASRTVFETVKLMPTAYQTMTDVIRVIPEAAQTNGVKVIQNGGGCAIGKHLHDDPLLPNIPDEATEKLRLEPGFAFVLMPMMTLGESDEYVVHEDGWTQVTKDGALSAHFAETILVTDSGLEILTAVESAETINV